jgi:hypothetical protein
MDLMPECGQRSNTMKFTERRSARLENSSGAIIKMRMLTCDFLMIRRYSAEFRRKSSMPDESTPSSLGRRVLVMAQNCRQRHSPRFFSRRSIRRVYGPASQGVAAWLVAALGVQAVF